MREEDSSKLAEYASIPISFTVDKFLEVELLQGALGGFRFTERKVTPSYVKGYDQMRNEGPLNWQKRWDVSNWAIFSAFLDYKRVEVQLWRGIRRMFIGWKATSSSRRYGI